MAPSMIYIGRIVVCRETGQQCKVTGIERYRFGLCKRFTVQFDDGTEVTRNASELKPPPAVKRSRT